MPGEIEIVDEFDLKYFDKIIDLYESIEEKCHFSSNILNKSDSNINIKSDFMDFILYSLDSKSIIKNKK